MSTPHQTQATGHIEWYTPVEIIEAARATLGAIDLDPASCDAANGRVRAAQYYDAEANGLVQPWHGRVWLNPPYARGVIDAWAGKLLAEVEAGRVYAAVVLVNNATETKWWQALARQARGVCFLSGRVRFIDGRTDRPAQSPLQGQTALYYGDARGAFWAHFEDLGVLL